MVQRMNYTHEPRRQILCIDVKSFFASVEAVDRHLHPLEAYIAVVSKPENNGGLVLAASPMVKQTYGIRTGSRIYDIPKRSKIQIVEPRMALYLEKNIEILKIFKQFVSGTDLMVYSIDESFLDVTHSRQLFGSAEEIAKKIQYLIWKKMNLVVTVGIGDNPLLAKLALDHEAKNSRQKNFIADWRYELVEDTVWNIHPMADFWGIGSRTEARLLRMGISSIYELSQFDVHKLKKKIGVIGEQLFYHAHGIDRTQFSETFTPRSTSFSKNQILNRDYTDKHEVEIVIREMTEENAMRLRRHSVTTSVVKLSLGYSKHIEDRGFNHQMIIEATDSSKDLIHSLLLLFERHYTYKPVRVINVSFGKIRPKQSLQLNLFEETQQLIDREELDKTIDHIRQKHGYTSLLHASSLVQGGMALQRSKLLGGHRSGIQK
ncbi:Y-family DNA polymerase [Marinilactibacillus sp. XAAS-LB27]|uniref:Y-family DNA polymerase n=1 Tax=Marinilactibacillus sp. XAAS-LB27 TaxID=3114538 RepID=UPI002E16EF09|nr:Y-family DNA polymerase [Marinilactibacillus sp. XAAS-LB27]